MTDISGALGRGGYEGIQDDNDGNIWILEDVGGANKPGTTAKLPNSFLFRYVPRRPGDLANGKLQVLQVLNAAGTPITFESQTPLSSPDQVALHTYGSVFSTKWVTIHDTATDGTTPFSANALAKAAHGTPFKRPENGLFRPNGRFTEFFFDETGDTNATSPENDCCGGWTGVFKLTQSDPSAGTGKITIFYKGDMAHAGFDNVGFFSKDLITFVEDAGDGLHTQRNALDSAFILDVTKDYSRPSNHAASLARRGSRCLGDARRRQRRLRQERRRQRDHRHARLQRRSDEGRDPGRTGAQAVEQRLARLLHAAARRQLHVRSRPFLESAGQRRLRREQVAAVRQARRGRPGFVRASRVTGW